VGMYSIKKASNDDFKKAHGRDLYAPVELLSAAEFDLGRLAELEQRAAAPAAAPSPSGSPSPADFAKAMLDETQRRSAAADRYANSVAHMRRTCCV